MENPINKTENNVLTFEQEFALRKFEDAIDNIRSRDIDQLKDLTKLMYRQWLINERYYKELVAKQWNL
jgi:asparagine synthetase A